MLFWLAGASSIAAQSADKILKQSVKAITKGAGEKALRRVTSWQATGTIVRSRDGSTGRFQTSAMRPDLYAFNWEIGGFETSAGFTGKSSWRRDSRDGLRTLTGKASDDLLAEAWHRNRRWLDYKKDRAKLVYAGSATVNGKAAHALTLTNTRGAQLKLYFDAASGLLVKEELPAGEGSKTIEYGDYHAVNGLTEPFAMTLFDGEERYEIRLEQITHNPPLDRAIFNFPRVSNEPLPDLGALFAKLRENQQALDELREKYGYTETITQLQLDKQGKIKEKESETYQFTYYRRHRVRRLVAKNGQPLSSGDQAKEDRRIEKLILDLDEGKPVRIPYNQRRFKLGDLLRVSRFSNPRRERFRHRDVVVTDFEPDPKFKPENLDDTFVHNLAGSMWIDIADLQIARVEFQLIDAFKVGGGAFFMMKPGSRFVTEQDRFNNEIWLPAYTEVTISARAMIFANFGILQKVIYGDYRRFDVNSEEKLKSPVDAGKPVRP
ncbi:MAG: hypothetical protein ACREAM_06680 [Blastocatellia bacterium]